MATACTAGSPGAENPGRHNSSNQCDTDQGPSQGADALPRYFTVELRASELAKEQLTADGATVAWTELPALLRKEAQSGAIQGGAVVAMPGVSSEQIFRVFREMSAAGFSHVLVSGLDGEGPAPAHEPARVHQRTEPAGSNDTVRAESEAASDAPGDQAPPEQEEPEQEEAVPDDVIVKKIGLHVGGGPNTTATEARYGDPITRHFDEFRRCHLLAKNRGRNASFGVDLLIGTEGGRPKIKDYRTALGGKDFHLCVLGVFGDISFPAPPRPTVISYSLLFKPQ